MKNKVSTLMISLLVMVVLVGCASNLGNAKFPKSSTNYVLKKELNISYDKLFGVIANVLEDNRASIVSQDKATGKITTDYIQGVTQATAGGLLGVIQTRYKYNISITKLNKNKSKINIICTLESSGNKMSAWRDVTSDNIELVKSLEDWLYEQIDIASRKA
jgi:hypothetical protein